jgi:nicotinamidase-related amidase
MSLNDLASRAAVLLVDHQEGIAQHASTAKEKTVDRTAAALVKAAQLYNMPIIVSGIAMGAPPKLTRALGEALGTDVHIYVRSTTDSFDNAEIRSAIEATGRTTVLIAGIVTEIAVMRPALSGKERGLDTRVVFDACNGASERSELASIERMQHSGVVLTSVPAILGELAVDFSDPRAQKAIGLMMEL